MNYFKDLTERGVFHSGNILEEEALWYCFSGILQEDLNEVMEHWNTHRIRDSRHDTIPGSPDELYLLPECHGGIDGLLLSISDDQLQFVSDHLLQSDEESNDYEEYFDSILANSDLALPNNWKPKNCICNWSLSEVSETELDVHVWVVHSTSSDW